MIFSYIYRKLRKKRKMTEVKEESICISHDEIVKNEIKHKICDMIILGEEEIENIKKMSYISILEILLLIIRCNNYMIEYCTRPHPL